VGSIAVFFLLAHLRGEGHYFCTKMKTAMKKLLMMVAPLLLLALAVQAGKGSRFGEKFNRKKAVSVVEFKGLVTEASDWSGVVKGAVKQVCKSEGCWLRLDDGSKDGIMVKMKDHKFLVPKDIDGKTVYVSGVAKKTVTSVEMQRHYAEDAGKSKAEIDAIVAPKVEIKMDAVGVMVM
jgi:hypothetical protein